MAYEDCQTTFTGRSQTARSDFNNGIQGQQDDFGGKNTNSKKGLQQCYSQNENITMEMLDVLSSVDLSAPSLLLLP